MTILNTALSSGSHSPANIFSKVEGVDNTATSLLTNNYASSASDQPATNVSISPQAQAVMERIEAERKVAELLEKQLAGDTTETSVDIFFSSTSTDESTVEGDESGNLGLDALNSSFDDPQVAAKLGEIRERFMVGQVERKAGPEAAQAFKDALASGNVNVQKASDVPGVNYNTTITQIPGAGGTTGMRADTTFNPSPEIRETIDSGRAIVFWNMDAGDVYLTW